MAVNTTNSNSLPMSLQGVSIQSTLPSAIVPGTQPSKGIKPVAITAPVQVIGLVPVFNCCLVTATFDFADIDLGTDTTFQIVIGSTNYGTFTSNMSDSNATIQAAIEAILTPPFTVVVSGGDFIHRHVVITIDDNSYSGAIVSVTVVSGDGHVTGHTNFSKPSGCDCRQGTYGADAIPDDTLITLPVFADPTATAGAYSSDTNTWLFAYPGTYNAITHNDFSLQQFSSGTWSTIATLNSSTYGTPYHSSCTNVNYSGYTLDWTKVYNAFGEGTYRFHVTGFISKAYNYCLSSPAFCLKLYSCEGVDGTVRFDAAYSGGNFGSATTQGISWTLCCNIQGRNAVGTIAWTDSLRYYGFFGYTNYDKIVDSTKYHTGVISKNRDETVKKFTLKLGAGTDKNWPQWMIERFVAYGMEADKLLANDYNVNNPQYNFKKYWVAGDGNVAPDYKGSSRYMKVKEIAFKEGQQYIYRDRCCG